MTMVMHPMFPVYNHHADAFTPTFTCAYRRIFTIMDRDGDGALKADELAAYQLATSHVRVMESEMHAILRVSSGAFMRTQVVGVRKPRPFQRTLHAEHGGGVRLTGGAGDQRRPSRRQAHAGRLPAHAPQLLHQRACRQRHHCWRIAKHP